MENQVQSGDDGKILVHVGYPKCASSWLQSSVFTQAAAVVTPWPTVTNEVIEKFVWLSDGNFDAAAVRQEFFDDWRAIGRRGMAVVSHEVLVGNPILGIYGADHVAERISKVFPEARILICVREQASLAHSIWCEYVRRGGAVPFETFVSREGVGTGYRSMCAPEYFDFASVVAKYAELFGRDRVLCLPIEVLRRAPQEFSRRLAEFCGHDEFRNVPVDVVYPGAGVISTEIRRMFNRAFRPLSVGRGKRSALDGMFGRVSSALGKRMPPSFELKRSARAKAAFMSEMRLQCSESNLRLQDFVEFSLKELGYAMP